MVVGQLVFTTESVLRWGKEDDGLDFGSVQFFSVTSALLLPITLSVPYSKYAGSGVTAPLLISQVSAAEIQPVNFLVGYRDMVSIVFLCEHLGYGSGLVTSSPHTLNLEQQIVFNTCPDEGTKD